MDDDGDDWWADVFGPGGDSARSWPAFKRSRISDSASGGASGSASGCASGSVDVDDADDDWSRDLVGPGAALRAARHVAVCTADRWLTLANTDVPVTRADAPAVSLTPSRCSADVPAAASEIVAVARASEIIAVARADVPAVTHGDSAESQVTNAEVALARADVPAVDDGDADDTGGHSRRPTRVYKPRRADSYRIPLLDFLLVLDGGGREVGRGDGLVGGLE